MTADSDSHIAWQRAQLRKLRAALKEVEVSQPGIANREPGIANREPGIANCGRSAQMTIVELQRKISESGRCIAEYERRTRRPLATDLSSLASVSWTHWNANLPVSRSYARPQRQRA
jgi:hypothetical protein